ncbi:unnamed protein product [Caenorhabditis brenneri]
MEKPKPVWQDLPRHLKVLIAGELSYKSRISFGLCSKSEYEIVQTLPFIIETVRVGPSLTGNTNIADAYFTTCQHQKTLHGVPTETAIQNFINAVKHPKTVIDSLIFNIGSAQDTIYSKMIPELKARKLKIQVKNFLLNGTYQSKELDYTYETYLELLEFLDANVLEMIEIGSIVGDGFLSKLVKTEHWKNAKSVSMCIAKCDDVNLEDFMHFTRLNLRGYNYLNQENKMKLVENFQKRDLPVNSFFIVSSYIRSLTMAIDDRQSEEFFDMPTSGNKIHVENFSLMVQGRVVGRVEEENLNIHQLLFHLHVQ